MRWRPSRDSTRWVRPAARLRATKRYWAKALPSRGGANNTRGSNFGLRGGWPSGACRLTDVMGDQSRSGLVGAGLVEEIKINWVWNPPWGPDKITEDGREQLRALGFTV